MRQSVILRSPFAQEFLGRVAEQRLLQYLNRGLSPARERYQKALKKLVTLLGRESLVKVHEFG